MYALMNYYALDTTNTITVGCIIHVYHRHGRHLVLPIKKINLCIPVLKKIDFLIRERMTDSKTKQIIQTAISKFEKIVATPVRVCPFIPMYNIGGLIDYDLQPIVHDKNALVDRDKLREWFIRVWYREDGTGSVAYAGDGLKFTNYDELLVAIDYALRQARPYVD
jgi:hypothetical protein